ncbi:MAG: hypothetical protein J1E57_06935 [Prevotella sp.]|nr:hypothetical protein [Prevotella sp.]
MVLDEFTAASSPNLNINYFYSMIFRQKSYYKQDWKTQMKKEEVSAWKLSPVSIEFANYCRNWYNDIYLFMKT